MFYWSPATIEAAPITATTNSTTAAFSKTTHTATPPAINVRTSDIYCMNLSFLLGIMYARFRPSERTKKIRIYFQATETRLLELFLKNFGGVTYKYKTYLLYELLSEKDLRRFRKILIKSDIPMLQPWRNFLDYYAPLPKRMRGKTRRVLKLYKENRSTCSLKTENQSSN